MTCSKQGSIEESVERPRGDFNLVDAPQGRTLRELERIEVYTSFCPEDKFGCSFQSEYVVKGHIVGIASAEGGMISSL